MLLVIAADDVDGLAASTAALVADDVRARVVLVRSTDEGSVDVVEPRPAKHACSMQVRMSVVALGQIPPQVSATVTLRVRVAMPDPHVVEQGDHEDQVENWQLAGQHVAPHASVSLSAPHEPPHEADEVVVRVRVRC